MDHDPPEPALRLDRQGQGVRCRQAEGSAAVLDRHRHHLLRLPWPYLGVQWGAARRPGGRRPERGRMRHPRVQWTPFPRESGASMGAVLVYALAAAESFASAPVAIKPRDPLAKCKLFKNKAKSARSGSRVKLSEGSTRRKTGPLENGLCKPRPARPPEGRCYPGHNCPGLIEA
ncbi:protein of unknown function [Candidatus Methylocalor cossyra]|uniref:Uncharacterized protein n=1 Tax=Candidatus Methylocalor cossyra TaxID=3108543 RepID=A0ABP1CB30_9GAMM